MAFSPIALTIPNYRDFKNYWIKAYVPSTTTPKVMATDKTGAITVAKFELNTEGFPNTAGGALVTPYIDDTYDLWLFPTEAEADANDTTNALRLAINVVSDANADDTVISFPELSDAVASVDASIMVAGRELKIVERVTGSGGGAGWGVVLASTVTPDAISVVQCVGIPTLALVLRVSGLTSRQMGFIADGVTDESAKLLVMDSLGGGVINQPLILCDADVELVNEFSFLNGGSIRVAALKTLTMNEINAVQVKIFDVALNGIVILNEKIAFTSWFGAVADAVFDNSRLFQLAINAVGRAGTVIVKTADINTHYHLDSTVFLDFDELVFKGEQFRVRIGADSDITLFEQSDRLPEAFFGLNVLNVDAFNNVASGSTPVIKLNRSFLFILNNVYVDKSPGNGFEFDGICAQGVISDCVAEECQGNGFSESSGAVLLSYRDCQSFANDGRGFSSGNNSLAYGNSLTGCKAFNNGTNNFNRGDARVSLTGCTSRNGSQASSGTHSGIVLGSSAINASVKGCVSFDDQGSPTQAFGFETNHYSQDIDSPMGSGNVTGIVNNNAGQPIEVIASGGILLPSVPQNALIRVDTEAAAASDNLDFIPRGFTNQIIVLKTADNARNVTYRDEVNTLSLAGNFTTTSTKDRLVLQYDRTENRWVEISRSDNQ